MRTPFPRVVVSLTVIAATLIVQLGASAAPGSYFSPATDAALRKLTPRLAALATPAVQQLPSVEQARQLSLPPSGGGSLLRFGSDVLVDVRVTNTSDATLKAIGGVIARIVTVAAEYGIVVVAISPAALPALATLPAVISVAEELAPLSAGASNPSVSSVARDATVAACSPTISEGDHQLRANLARANFGVSGSGITVGILSDTFDTDFSAITRASNDIASGDLPGPGNPCGHAAPVNIVKEGNLSGADEGRAMAQIVHDIAPNARLAYASAQNGLFEFANNIRGLQSAGARVIADDWFNVKDPFFQSGPVANAIKDVTQAGVTYLSAAGNFNVIVNGHGVGSWESPAFRPMGCPDDVPVYSTSVCEDFDPAAGSDNKYAITLPANGRMLLIMQWSEPWFGVSDDFDLYVLNQFGALAARSDSLNADTGQPVEYVFVQNGGSQQTFQVVIIRRAGSGTPRLKFVLANADVTNVEYPVSQGSDKVGPTIMAHNGAPDAISVGAVPYNDSSKLEPFSSAGPVTYYWGPADSTAPAAALPSPQVIAKPDLVATDGGANTFFGQQDGSVYRFYGSSASVVHAAGVVALMLDAFPSLTPAQVKNILKSHARTVGSAPANRAGSGLIDANASVAAVVPAVSISDAAHAEGDSGASTLTFTVSLSKADSVPVTIRFRTEDVTAQAGSDYVQRTGSVTFAPGQTTRPIVITINGDTAVEPNETFRVRLRLPTRARIVDDVGLGRINNDD